MHYPHDTHACRWSQLARHVSRFFTVVITAVIITLIVIKSTSLFWNLMSNNTYFVWNVAVAATCWVCCVVTLIAYARRYLLAKRTGLEFSHRRWRLSHQALWLLIVQILNLTCMIVGLSLIIPRSCRWRNHASSILGIVQWTCWNTTFMILIAMAHSLTILRRKEGSKSGDRSMEATKSMGTFRSLVSLASVSKRLKGTQLVLDAPILSVHWEKVLMWVFFEIWPVLLMWSFWGFLYDGCAAGLETGDDGDTICVISDRSVAFISMMIASVGMYMIVYLFYSSRTQDDVESRSYAEMKFVRIAYGVQHGYVLPLFLVLMISVIVLTAVRINTCWTYVEQWLGLSAWQATGTICACTLAYFYMPVVGRDRGVVLSLLQDFCWSEKAEQDEMDARNEILTRVNAEDERSTDTPMFCVETCIRHLYLANYVYSCEGKGRGGDATNDRSNDDVNDGADNGATEDNDADEDDLTLFLSSSTPGIGNLEDAMALWEADGHEVIAEGKTDTVALAIWNKDRLALAFKGTSSAQNVKTDLNVLKSLHEPKRRVQVSAGFTKKLSIPQTPYVHRGFWKSWTMEDFHGRIKTIVQWYIDTYHAHRQDSGAPIEIHVTGHSLGGALATLAAIDLTKSFNVDTTVYTFGQPRVGNKAFATDYDNTVPRHFSVAHGQDPVARVPKGSYRKNGIRVFTSSAGDVVVAPNSLESHVLQNTPQIADHFLESYRKAWMTSIKQQFGPKSVDGLRQTGRAGATELASAMQLDRFLMGSNLDIESLESFDLRPLSEEDLHKIKLREEKEARLREAKTRATHLHEGEADWPPSCSPSLGCGGRPKTAE